MTSYGAYDAGLPCKNPSCASHGKPHPNCRCYGDMAEGGNVEPYCAKDQAHKPDCEYFADGGSVKPSSTSDEEIVNKLTQHSDEQDTQEPDMAAAIANAGAPGLFKGIKDHDSYQRHVKSGASKIDRHLNALFDGTRIEHDIDDKQRDKVKKYMEGGGLHQNLQAQLHGTDSSNPMLQPAAEATPLSMSHPAQNLQLQTARGRIADYLNTLRPSKDGPKLAFDDHMEDADKSRSYNKAVDLAINPLSILHHVGAGTIEPDHLKHLKSMYPDVDTHLQKKITEKIVEAQLDEKKPSFKVRQGLSMMMGTPLSSDFTPAAIQAAQGVFAAQKQSQPPASPPKGGKSSKSSLTKSDQAYLTGNQALEKRQNKV